jgi:SNF family Na+-dependent transporter
MEFKGRVIIAMTLLIFSKLANVSVSLMLKGIIDALDKTQAILLVPVFFVIAYGALKKRDSEIVQSVVLVALGNTLISFLSAFAVFGTLGYLALQQ